MLSFILIGFGKTTRRDLGETGREQPCVWCSARVSYHLVRVRTWFTYFFIPVVPYRKRFRVECPVCGLYVVLTNREVRAAMRGELTLRRGGVR